MAKIAEYTERNIDYAKAYHSVDFIIQNTLDAISHSAVGMAIDLNAKAVVVCSMSGMTARMVSRFRGPVDIVAMTTNEKAWRKLALSWGVLPKMSQSFQSTDVLFYQAKNVAREALSLSRGDLLVITGGVTNGQSGNTSILKVETV
jgi:pyruvate kinase